MTIKRSLLALATFTLSSGLSLSAAVAVEPAPPIEPLSPASPLQAAPLKAAPLQVESANVYSNDVPKESIIDRTDYSIGATARDTTIDPLAGPSEKVNIDISSREQKPGFSPQPSERVARNAPAQLNLGGGIGGLTISSNQGISWTPSAPSEQSVVTPLPAYFNQKLLQPFSRLGLQNVKFIYPLAIPSPISSLFGWRIHPISGVSRMHTGTDIAAPEGTPVLAAMAGKVLLADNLGGYGLTIALEHGDGTEQTLYGHLSEIFVKPGELIKQGAVIGRVGSTGNSTGPHLHLEFRQLTDAGWMAIDPGTLLENSMNDLAKALKNGPTPQQQALKLDSEPLTQPSKSLKSQSLKLELPNLSLPLISAN
jgi:murein DD-endopeptidase MepM/ murein hydrolase activator NlpD